MPEFKALSRNLTGGTEEDYETHQDISLRAAVYVVGVITTRLGLSV